MGDVGWGELPARAEQELTEVAQNLTGVGDTPANEYQVRPLTKLDPTQRQRDQWD